MNKIVDMILEWFPYCIVKEVKNKKMKEKQKEDLRVTEVAYIDSIPLDDGGHTTFVLLQRMSDHKLTAMPEDNLRLFLENGPPDLIRQFLVRYPNIDEALLPKIKKEHLVIKVKELLKWLQEQSEEETVVGFVRFNDPEQRALAVEVTANCSIGVLIKERIDDPHSQFMLS